MANDDTFEEIASKARTMVRGSRAYPIYLRKNGDIKFADYLESEFQRRLPELVSGHPDAVAKLWLECISAEWNHIDDAFSRDASAAYQEYAFKPAAADVPPPRRGGSRRGRTMGEEIVVTAVHATVWNVVRALFRL
jgi:hypothetical protein